MKHDQPFIDGNFLVLPDGRRLPRVRGGEETEEEKTAREKREAEEKDRGKRPPWGSDEEFDPEKAWKLIQNLRADNEKLKTDNGELKTKVQKHEDATKSDSEKLEARATTAETNASKATNEAARLRVALTKGLTETQAKRLVGDSEEDLEKDADELLASFKKDGESNDDDRDQEPRRRPQERLRSGTSPSSEPEETDPEKLAAKVPRPY